VCDDHPVRRRYFYETLARVLVAPEPRFVAPPTGQPPPHEEAHRRINNRRMKEELHAELRYPDYSQGLRASV
jgi:nucleoside-diphosphate-sugar epimerase